MSAESIANEVATAQGWNDTTLLDLTLSYIDRQGANDAFGDYLRGVAEVENTAAGDLYDESLDGDLDDQIDDETDEGDVLHDSLHSAAESYASDLNNTGAEHRRAFLMAAGVPAADIDAAVAEDPEDGLDSRVIEVASQTASRAYNNDGTAEQVYADLDAICAPYPAAVPAEAAEESEFGPYDWTCTYCGSALNEDNRDETGSRRCYSADHVEHLDEGDGTEFEDESHG